MGLCGGPDDIGRDTKPDAGGGNEVRNFLQFSKISCNFLQFFGHVSALPILRACWHPLLSMVNHTSVHKYAER